MKTVYSITLLAAMALSAFGAEEKWRKVAFIGDAKVMKISGLVEVVVPSSRIVHEGEKVKVGETLRVYRGAELILQMDLSKSLVRAEGPVLLRLATEKEGFNRASITGKESANGFVVRAVREGGRFFDGERWQAIKTGMTLPAGSKVRPFRNGTLDFYHPSAGKAFRVTDHKRQTTLAYATDGGNSTLAAKAP